MFLVLLLLFVFVLSFLFVWCFRSFRAPRRALLVEIGGAPSASGCCPACGAGFGRRYFTLPVMVYQKGRGRGTGSVSPAFCRGPGAYAERFLVVVVVVGTEGVVFVDEPRCSCIMRILLFIRS